jgi:hypothetical protein
MTRNYLFSCLMPGQDSAIVQIGLRLNPGDGFEGLHSCPAWF